VETQRAIMRDAVDILVPGGAILYSTCSIEPEENEGQVEWAIRELGLLSAGPKRTMPAGLPGEGPAAYHDGAFSAVLRRA
jgi:16S rRNA C967 or C1407 C5-methylase (RsmB/RsmF family)